MKKLFSLLLCLNMLLSCLALAGCHGKLEAPADAEDNLPSAPNPAANAFEVPESFDESKPISISFWAKNDSNAVQQSIYRQAIEDFQSLYPNVTVNLRLYTDYGTIYSDVITNVSTNTTPNVCVSYPDHVATYLTGEHVVVSLEELANDPNYGLGGAKLKFDSPSMEEVVPQFLGECRIGGVLYALPFMRSTEACYVNKTFVEKLGYELPEILTWDFVWEVSEAAMAKESDGKTFAVNGQTSMIPFIYKSTDNMMIQMLRQKGAGYTTEDGEVLIFNDDTEELLYTIGEHAKSRAFSTFKISGYPGNFFNAGRCIFGVDSTAGATWIGSHAPLIQIAKEQLVEFETVVLPIPQFDPEHPQMISQGPSVCLFNKDDPQEVLASWLFAQFLLTNSVQIPYAETEGYVPVTLKAQQDPAYQDYLARAGEDAEHYDVKIQASKLLMENTQNTFTTPVFNGSTDVRNAAGMLIESVCSTVRSGKPLNEAYLEKLRSDVCSRYQLTLVDEETPLPAGSRALLIGLAATWALIGVYAGYSALKRKREKRKT
jgi:multiple sugar transport system substrate-binding protein